MQKKIGEMFNATWEYRKGVGKKKLNSTEKRLRQLCEDLEVKLPINLDESSQTDSKLYILGT